MVVSGAVVSTVQVLKAGVASVSPVASVALTRKVCDPSERLTKLLGELHPRAAGFVIGVVLPVLEVVTPALFLGGFLGLYFWPGRGGGPLHRAALPVGLIGMVLGLLDEYERRGDALAAAGAEGRGDWR
jgi:hypothetical protein